MSISISQEYAKNENSWLTWDQLKQKSLMWTINLLPLHSANPLTFLYFHFLMCNIVLWLILFFLKSACFSSNEVRYYITVVHTSIWSWSYSYFAMGSLHSTKITCVTITLTLVHMIWWTWFRSMKVMSIVVDILRKRASLINEVIKRRLYSWNQHKTTLFNNGA